MSVIIHGLDMPKTCHECPLNVSIYTYDGGDETCALKAWDGYSEQPKTTRHPDCPLVPLPEGHGDLIDRDAFRADYGLGKDCENCDRNTRNCNYDICLSRMDVCGWIDDAPTIVPAEGGKADGN